MNISFFAPKRFGFTSSIETVQFKDIKDGPSDEHVSLVHDQMIGYVSKDNLVFDEKTIYKNKTNNQTVQKQYIRMIKEYISAFAVARMTIDCYKSACKRLGNNKMDHIKVNLNTIDHLCAVGSKNAYTIMNSSNEGTISFCKRDNPSTASFFDVVCHETGHIICSTVNKISNVKSWVVYTAFHEFFGDMAVYFTSIHLCRIQGNIDSCIKEIEKSPQLCIAGGLLGKGCMRDPQQKTYSCDEHSNSKNLSRFMLNLYRNVLNLIVSKENKDKLIVDELLHIYLDALVLLIEKNITFDSLYNVAKIYISELEKLIAKNKQLVTYVNDVSKICQQSLKNESTMLNKCK